MGRAAGAVRRRRYCGAIALTGTTILVLLGTDHHPFHRLISWADAWAREHPADSVTVQHGRSPAPQSATAIDYLSRTDLRSAVARADVVITHGGPGTVADARASGHKPLTVPRDPAHGEHVDTHQQRFVPWAGERNLVRPCRAPTDLDAAVADVAAADGTREDIVGLTDPVVTAKRFAQLLERTTGSRMPAAADAPLVLYIGGAGRSGSTLLERVLAEAPGVVALGEVNHLLRRGVLDDELCACGERFSSCAFWREVGERAFGGWKQVDADRLLGLKLAVDRQRHIPRTTRRRVPRALRADLLEYAAYFRAIYEAVSAMTGARMIVDSSKHASLALALSHDRHIDLRVLHLTRDSRGVAFSWSKAVQRPETSDGTLMPRMSPVESTLTWAAHNLTIEGLRYRRVPVARMRYEDFVAAPREEIADAWTRLDLPGTPDVPLRDDRSIDLAPTHSVAGNPLRFRTGRTTLRPDTQWRSGMAARDRATVTAMSAPVMRWLGYGRSRTSASAPSTEPAVAVAYKPDVSVVVATRDRPEMLREAIESVRAQAYDGVVETVVVYDQSEPDHTLRVADARRPVRIVTNRRSPGLAGARNSGIESASGEVIAFCDDDDLWLPDKLRQQVHRLADPAVDFVSCGIRVRYDEDEHDRTLDVDEVTFRDLLRDRHTELHPSTFVIRRAAINERIGLVDEAVPGGFGEDYELLLRAARDRPIANVRGPHVVVRWGKQSYFLRRWEMMRDGLTWLLDRYPEFDTEPAGSARVRSQIAFARAALGDRSGALRWARGAFRRNPLEPRTVLAAAVSTGLVSPDTVMARLHHIGRGI